MFYGHIQLEGGAKVDPEHAEKRSWKRLEETPAALLSLTNRTIKVADTGEKKRMDQLFTCPMLEQVQYILVLNVSTLFECDHKIINIGQFCLTYG